MSISFINKATALSLLAVALTTSCREDFDFDNARRQNAEYNFEQNFSQIYGAIDPNQNWDFSTGAKLANTRAGITSISVTQVDGLSYDFNNGKTAVAENGKNYNVYNGINSALPEGVQHTGTPAVLVAPDNGFWIFPVQTQTGAKYEAYVKVGDQEPQKIFDKNWTNHDRLYCNGMKIGNSSNYVEMPGLYIEAPIGTPIQVYIKRTDNTLVNGSPYLGTQNGAAILVDCTEKPSGFDYPEGAEIQYIGIEDWPVQGDKDYNDLVLVMVGKPKVPHEVFIEEGYIFPTTSEAKRYMVEDMGYSDPSSTAADKGYTDIDFNDIVIDFEKVTEHKYKVTTINGGLPEISTEDEEGWPKYSYAATVRALGGTWDFILYVDEETKDENNEDIIIRHPVFQKSTASSATVTFNDKYTVKGATLTGLSAGTIYNTARKSDMRGDGNYNLTGESSWICTLKSSDIAKWKPEANNISFKIVDTADFTVGTHFYDSFDSNTDEGNVYSLHFPAMGETPKIVAFDIDKPWQKEKVHVTTGWFSNNTSIDETHDQNIE